MYFQGMSQGPGVAGDVPGHDFHLCSPIVVVVKGGG